MTSRSDGVALSGDLNLVLNGLCLRGLNGPRGLIRMSGWRRHRYNKDVAAHVRLALNIAGLKTLAGVQELKKSLKVTVVHKGVFDQDSLYASVKPVIDALKPLRVRVDGREIGMEPGLIPDDCPEWLSYEVLQEKGTPCVRIEASGRSMPEAFKGKKVSV